MVVWAVVGVWGALAGVFAVFFAAIGKSARGEDEALGHLPHGTGASARGIRDDGPWTGTLRLLADDGRRIG